MEGLKVGLSEAVVVMVELRDPDLECVGVLEGPLV
jgi:hypothetical protein